MTASGYGEGERFLGTVDVTTDGSGHAAFSANVAGPLGNAEFVTATATDSAGNTSEFSACMTAVTPTVISTPGGSVDVVSSAGTIVGGTSSAVPGGPTPPSGVAFPYGLVGFQVTGLGFGETVTITETFPGSGHLVLEARERSVVARARRRGEREQHHLHHHRRRLRRRRPHRETAPSTIPAARASARRCSMSRHRRAGCSTARTGRTRSPPPATSRSRSRWRAARCPTDSRSADDGTLSGTPTTAGTSTFTVTATNDAGSDTSADITITIVDPDAPVAHDDIVTTGENVPLAVYALSNDTDSAGLPLPTDLGQIGGFQNDRHSAAGGYVTAEVGLNNALVFVYSPPFYFTGTDSFTYTVFDGSGHRSNVATVHITVDPGTAAPVATYEGMGPAYGGLDSNTGKQSGCSATGFTYQFHAAGAAGGRFAQGPGLDSYTATGTVVVGPDEGAGYDPGNGILVKGRILSFQLNFTVTQGDTTMTGTEFLMPSSAPAYFTCGNFLQPSGPGVHYAYVRNFDVNVGYSATFTAPGEPTTTDTGTALIFHHDNDINGNIPLPVDQAAAIWRDWFQSTAPVAQTPEDSDGVTAATEDAAPNGGDGNNDGIPDSQQPEVSSLTNAADGQYVTVAAPQGTSLSNVVALDVATLPTPPAGADFPVGVLGFEVHDVQSTDPITVQIVLPPGVTPNVFYKFQNGSYVDATSAVTQSGNVLTLTLSDGGPFDADHTVNGTIVDPIIPATVTNHAPVAGDDGYSTKEDTVLTVPGLGRARQRHRRRSRRAARDDRGQRGHGSVVLAADGSFVYTPQANYFGPDSFTYKANDGHVDSNVATVTLTVLPVNDKPSFSMNVLQVVAEDAGSAERRQLGDGDQRRAGERIRPAAELHRLEHQPGVVLGAARDQPVGHADVHAGAECERPGARERAAPRQWRHCEWWSRHQLHEGVRDLGDAVNDAPTARCRQRDHRRGLREDDHAHRFRRRRRQHHLHRRREPVARFVERPRNEGLHGDHAADLHAHGHVHAGRELQRARLVHLPGQRRHA